MTKIQRRSGTITANGRRKDRYWELMCQFPLRPLRNDRDLSAATAMLHTLIDKPESTLTAAEHDYLELLGDIIERYEDIHYPMGDVSEGAMLAYFMELRELTQTQFAAGTGIAPSTISEILSGKRKLTRGQIEKLSAYFRVSPDVFFSTPKPAKKPAPKPRRKAAK